MIVIGIEDWRLNGDDKMNWIENDDRWGEYHSLGMMNRKPRINKQCEDDNGMDLNGAFVFNC